MFVYETYLKTILIFTFFFSSFVLFDTLNHSYVFVDSRPRLLLIVMIMMKVAPLLIRVLDVVIEYQREYNKNCIFHPHYLVFLQIILMFLENLHGVGIKIKVMVFLIYLVYVILMPCMVLVTTSWNSIMPSNI